MTKQEKKAFAASFLADLAKLIFAGTLLVLLPAESAIERVYFGAVAFSVLTVTSFAIVCFSK